MQIYNDDMYVCSYSLVNFRKEWFSCWSRRFQRAENVRPYMAYMGMERVDGIEHDDVCVYNYDKGAMVRTIVIMMSVDDPQWDWQALINHTDRFDWIKVMLQ